MPVLELNSKERKSTRDKANISNSKINRGCAHLTANRISADCVQISLGPSIPYVPLGIYHTGGFNAMNTAKSDQLIHFINVYMFSVLIVSSFFFVYYLFHQGKQLDIIKSVPQRNLSGPISIKL